RELFSIHHNCPASGSGGNGFGRRHDGQSASGGGSRGAPETVIMSSSSGYTGAAGGRLGHSRGGGRASVAAPRGKGRGIRSGFRPIDCTDRSVDPCRNVKRA